MLYVLKDNSFAQMWWFPSEKYFLCFKECDLSLWHAPKWEPKPSNNRIIRRL